MFLQEFLPAEVPWAHLDIAGVAHPRRDYRYLKGDQASGFGVRLIVELIKSGADQQLK
jgi:leucyl aminopeptidase